MRVFLHDAVDVLLVVSIIFIIIALIFTSMKYLYAFFISCFLTALFDEIAYRLDKEDKG